MKVARITLSDRASEGVYEDKSGPEIERVIKQIFDEPIEFFTSLLPDDPAALKAALIKACDEQKCDLVVTTGGTGPSPRDITPETTLTILEKELPGFGEIMRVRSYQIVPTAILSRAVAGLRGKSIVVNLPGNPRSIRVCLTLLQDAISEGLYHISGFRPKLKKDDIPEEPIERVFRLLGLMKKK